VHADFDRFFEESYPGVVGALTLVVGSREVAEDAAQHGFLQALRRWRRVRSMNNPVGWVYVVALHSSRRDRKFVDTAALLVGNSEAVDGEPDRVIDRELLRDAVEELTPRQRAVFVLRHAVGLSAVEVAEALEVKPGTVRALDHQARTRLRHVLESVGEQEEAFDAI
jgi:RNA polymerase sigma factor (sigma-70 family)